LPQTVDAASAVRVDGGLNVRDERVVDAYLENIAGGQTEYLSDLLLQLSDEILFTPVLSISNPDNAAGANVIKVATFSSAGRRIVPTFTSEENFIEWSAGKHQCFSVAGADLAISLPPNTWLVINPGKPASCELSPEQVAVVAASDRCADFDATRDTSEPEDDDARRATRTDLKSVVVAEAPLSGPERTSLPAKLLLALWHKKYAMSWSKFCVLLAKLPKDTIKRLSAVVRRECSVYLPGTSVLKNAFI